MPLNQTNNELTYEIRVFLSSTFKDMDEEHRYLVEHVFPQIRQACAQRQVVFTEIDLRWGTTEEESKNGRTVEICLEEIDRSRHSPLFFIGFLGERYGWIPEQKELDSYWQTNRDSNYAKVIEEALEQGISVNELEINYAFLDSQVDEAHARIYLRSPGLTKEIYKQQKTPIKECNFYDSADGKLDVLKGRLRNSSTLEMDGYLSVSGFGENVKQFLMNALDELYPEKNLSPLKRYLNTQKNYADSRLKGYVPLESFSKKLLEELVEADQMQTPCHLHIWGKSGSGKSAQIAYLNNYLKINFNAEVLTHYVGTDVLSTPSGWRDQLIERLKPEQDDINQSSIKLEDHEDVWDRLTTLLSDFQADCNKPVVILLDAINQMTQFEDLYEKINFSTLPKNIYLITTSIEPFPISRTQNHELPKLTTSVIRQISERYLKVYQKTLPNEVIDLISQSPSCQNGLFLKIVLEELRLQGRFKILVEQTKGWVALATPKRLFETVLSDLDSYYEKLGLPQFLASSLISLLHLSYRGLTHHQIKNILSKLFDVELHDNHIVPILVRMDGYLIQEQGRYRTMHSIFNLSTITHEQEIFYRKVILSNSDLDSISGLLDKVYQSLKLQEKLVLTEVIQDHMFEILQQDEVLLRDAMVYLGAGLDKSNEYISYIDSGFTLRSTSDFLNFSSMIIFLLKNNFFRLAEDWLILTLDGLRGLLPEEHSFIDFTLNNLVHLYVSQGRYNEAEPLFIELLAMNRATLPEGHSSIVISLDNLAHLYDSQGRYNEAEPLFIESLAMNRATLPEGHPSLALSLNNLAHLYVSQGRYNEAEPLSIESLGISKTCLPVGHAGIALNLNNLAQVYQSQGRHNEAEPLLIESLAISKNSLPEGHPSIASILNNLASLYYKRSRYDEAELLLIESLAISKNSLPKEHPTIVLSLNTLAHLYQSQGRYNEAELLFIELLAINKNSLPEGHPIIASSLNNLASLYYRRSRYDEAEPLLIESLAISKNCLPMGHPNITTILNNLVALYNSQGRYNEAKQKLEKFQGH